MNREDLIKKVQALRALAGNSASTLEEAETAASLAENIIQKNSLDEAEFEIANGSQEQVHEDGTPLTDWGQRQNVWQNILLTGLSEAYDCQGFLKSNGNNLGYYAVGRPSDISTMRYQFAFFHLEITRLAQILAPNNLQRGSGKHWYNSFYLGAVHAIVQSLKKVKQEVQAQANPAALAIIYKHADDAADWMKVYHPEMRSVRHKHPVNRDAYNLGKQAGSGLNAKPGLNSGFRGLLGQ